MNDVFEILHLLQAEDKEKFEEVMAYCDTRITADEGIPAVIALDDLTMTDNTGAFVPASDDRDMGLVMAVNAMLYTCLYQNRENKNLHYPSICPAMSAVAETCFRADYAADDTLSLVPYRDVIGAFIKKGEA
ncbi:MAG: hypothetical protein RSD27_08580 [Ruthenibacterium sp.]